jgi:hypothetical protein
MELIEGSDDDEIEEWGGDDDELIVVLKLIHWIGLTIPGIWFSCKYFNKQNCCWNCSTN